MTSIVLLPGMDGTGSLFNDFVVALQAKSLVVSYPTDQPLGYAELERFVLASLPGDEPFVLLGESFSGPLAIRIAAKQSPHLKAVVLACSFAKLPFPTLPSSVQKWVSRVPFWRVPPVLTARRVLGRFHSAQLQTQLAQVNTAVAAQVWSARLREVLAVDDTSLLCRINVPLLYLRARHDRLISASASARILEHVPGMKIVEIEGPHLLLQAKAVESAAAVRAFASEHGIPL